MGGYVAGRGRDAGAPVPGSRERRRGRGPSPRAAPGGPPPHGLRADGPRDRAARGLERHRPGGAPRGAPPARRLPEEPGAALPPLAPADRARPPDPGPPPPPRGGEAERGARAAPASPAARPLLARAPLPAP